jgi:hypothetical protein
VPTDQTAAVVNSKCKTSGYSCDVLQGHTIVLKGLVLSVQQGRAIEQALVRHRLSVTIDVAGQCQVLPIKLKGTIAGGVRSKRMQS